MSNKAFNPEVIAHKLWEIIKECGVTEMSTCMTRVRLNIKNKDLVDISKIKSIAGVLGVIDSAEQLQVIIGPGKVNQVASYLQPLIDLSVKDSHTSNNSKSNSSLPTLKQKSQHTGAFTVFLKRLANIFLPLLPGFIGCGLVMGIVNILNKTLSPSWFAGVTFDHTTIGMMLSLMGGAMVFGLSLFVGYNANKEFGGTPILGGVIAALLSMPGLVTLTIMGQPAIPGRGGIIAVLLGSFIASTLEKKLRRIIPSSLDLFVTPTLVLLITGSLAIFILQPIGGIISDLLTKGSFAAVSHGGAGVGFVLSAAFLPLVMTGLHQGLIPIHAELIKASGSTILLPILAMAGAGQVGAALAVWIKTKNAKLRHIIKSSIIVGLLGVGEPLIYGVTLPLFRPFLAACVGGGLGGALVAHFKLGATGLGISGLPLTLLIHNGMLLYLAAILLAYLGGFVATLCLGFDDSIFAEDL